MSEKIRKLHTKLNAWTKAYPLDFIICAFIIIFVATHWQGCLAFFSGVYGNVEDWGRNYPVSLAALSITVSTALSVAVSLWLRRKRKE